MRFFEIKDVVELLHAEIARTGSQSEWCRKNGVDRATLNKTLNGHRPPTREMIELLNLRVVYIPRDKSPRSK
jgi:DNA-binding phage protein